MSVAERRERLTKAFAGEKFGSSPNRKWMGLEFVDLDEEWVVLRAKWRPEMVGNYHMGVVQGGVQAGMIDMSCVYAIVAETGVPVPTINMHIDYHRPAMGEGDLTIRARVVQLGRVITTTEAYLYSDKDELLTSGRLTFYTGISSK